MVPRPTAPNRSSAAEITSRTSFTEALTADSCTNSLDDALATNLASVVLPVPGGPQKMTDVKRSASTNRRSGPSAPNRWRCPTTSVSRSGRSLLASGDLAFNRSSAAALNRFSSPWFLEPIDQGYRVRTGQGTCAAQLTWPRRHSASGTRSQKGSGRATGSWKVGIV